MTAIVSGNNELITHDRDVSCQNNGLSRGAVRLKTNNYD